MFGFFRNFAPWYVELFVTKQINNSANKHI